MKTSVRLIALVSLACLGKAMAQEPAPSAPLDLSPSRGSTIASSMDLATSSTSRVWADADYLLWWVKGAPFPSLLTSNSFGFTPTIGDDGTSVVFGGRQNLPALPGGRVTAGAWLGSSGAIGLEASGFVLGQQSATISNFGSANSATVYGLPYSLASGTPGSVPLYGNLNDPFSPPPAASNGATLLTNVIRLWGAEGNALMNLSTSDAWQFSALGGFRYINLTEQLNITNFGTAVDGVPPLLDGTIADTFGSQNRFYGGNIGGTVKGTWGSLVWGVTGKLALGVNSERIVAGETSSGTIFGAPITNQGLALASNSGTFTRDYFCLVPEVGLNFGYRLTSNVTLTTGWTFLYMSAVARPGAQIDTVFQVDNNGNLIRPRIPFTQSDFFAQGLNCGLQVRF